MLSNRILFISAKRLRVSAPRVRYSTSSPAPKACTAYLKPTHLDDHPSPAVLARLARYASATLTTYSRPPFILSHGKKCTVWDTDGREYLDFSGGIAVNALGHSDEGVAQVLADQSTKLVHNSNLWHNEWAGELAVLLVESTKAHGGMGFEKPAPVVEGEEVAPVVPPTCCKTGAADTAAAAGAPSGLKVFFSNSGTEANEGALKFARKWGKGVGGGNKDKVELVSFKDGFHGRSMGALSATWQEKYQAPFAPLVPGFVMGTLNDIESLKTTITEKTCGVIVEPIQVRWR